MTDNTFPDDVVEAVARALCKIEYPVMKPDREISPGRYLWQKLETEARAALSALAPYIAQREAAALERAAEVAENHRPPEPKRGRIFASEEIQQIIAAEQRGEKIAAKALAIFIRALKDAP